MHHVIVALSVVAVLIVLLALVLCFRAPSPKHKWLWALFVVFGLVQLSLATAGGSYKVVSVIIAFLRPNFIQSKPSAPSESTVVIPVGALVFLVRRRWLFAQNGG